MQAVSMPRPRVLEVAPLHQSVREALGKSGYHELKGVSVYAAQGGVRIEGIVRSYFLKQIAQTVAMSVKGVSRVDNFLTVE